MKETIKKIPFFGFLARWLNNLLRLNNIKHRVLVLEEELKILNTKLQAQEEDFSNELNTKLQAQAEDFSNMVAKEIFYQSLSLQQRVDQFAFDAKIELKTKIIEKNY